MLEVQAHPEHPPIWSAAQRGESVDWDALFEGYRATVDWPSCNTWQAQAQHFPDAKIILSTRDPESWHKSVTSTIYPMSMKAFESDVPAVHAMGAWAREIIWNAIFDGRLEDKDHAIRVYREHEARVKASVPAERLLVFEAREGWEPLCRFLDRPVPDDAYPRRNTTDEFLEMTAQRISGE
jgi:hypothetical protein